MAYRIPPVFGILFHPGIIEIVGVIRIYFASYKLTFGRKKRCFIAGGSQIMR
jgi:hypothetical protein